MSATLSFDISSDRHKVQAFYSLLTANVFFPEHSNHYESVALVTARDYNCEGLLSVEPDLSRMLPLAHHFFAQKHPVFSIAHRVAAAP